LSVEVNFYGKKYFAQTKPKNKLPAKTFPTPLPLHTHLSYEENLIDCGAICPSLTLLKMPVQKKKYNT
jgi:hypothetical protein